MLQQSDKGVGRPSFVDVARVIGDCRLEKALRELATTVETEIHNAGFVPLRADVRADVRRLKTEAKRFEIALNRVSKRSLELPIRESECLPAARQAMHNIVALCDKTLLIIPDKGGRVSKPGRITCAVIVIEAWAFVRGRAPSANNERVQEACDEYWRAIGKGGSSNWRRSITAARKNEGALRHYIRDEIRRCAEGPE
jgi:hypothetical protein